MAWIIYIHCLSFCHQQMLYLKLKRKIHQRKSRDLRLKSKSEKVFEFPFDWLRWIKVSNRQRIYLLVTSLGLERDFFPFQRYGCLFVSVKRFPSLRQCCWKKKWNWVHLVCSPLQWLFPWAEIRKDVLPTGCPLPLSFSLFFLTLRKRDLWNCWINYTTHWE